MDATTQDVTKRYTTPFGASRGAKSTTWPDDKAFLGKPADTTTGLTHIGAREYDPTIGQFISVDPVLDPAQHQSLNGYAYGNNNPVTSADPTGMWIDDGTGHSEPRRDGGPAGPSSPTPGKASGTASGGRGKTGAGAAHATRNQEYAQHHNDNYEKIARECRLDQLINGEYGEIADIAGDAAKMNCKLGGGMMCGLSDFFTEEVVKEQVEKYLEGVLSRIDESWGRNWGPKARRKTGLSFDLGFSDEEFETASYLARKGHDVMSRDDTEGGDAYVNDVRVDFKRVITDRSSTIVDRLGRANKQAARGVRMAVVDLRPGGASEETARTALRDFQRTKTSHLKSVMFIVGDSHFTLPGGG
ncbi:RHS repeat-associated core domain-containing protein [Streptomyces sp. NPDC048685]|uniref:RHS repeat-associated core domain-containing protein n=1 Tax=Streptomyces sp. NPDC048685 TaxID=3365584 RepID=UPI00371EE7BF